MDIHRLRDPDVLHGLHRAQLQGEKLQRGRAAGRQHPTGPDGMGPGARQHARAVQARARRDRRRGHVPQSPVEAMETGASGAREARQARRGWSRRLHETRSGSADETEVQGEPVQHHG